MLFLIFLQKYTFLLTIQTILNKIYYILYIIPVFCILQPVKLYARLSSLITVPPYHCREIMLIIFGSFTVA